LSGKFVRIFQMTLKTQDFYEREEL